MKAEKLSLAALAWVALVTVGCGESVPENTKPADGSNSHVSGTPQDRIQKVQGDASLSPEEKARRIELIKSRNKL